MRPVEFASKYSTSPSETARTDWTGYAADMARVGARAPINNEIINFLEKDNQEILFEKLHNFLQKIVLDEVSCDEILSDYIKLELKILKVLGYGLDLSVCAVTNSKTNLAFVSPKSARAVCFEVGLPYQNKLLKLPKFLVQEDANLCND